MSEKLSYRRETAAAQFEQTDKYRAMQYLGQVGVIKKVNQLNLFHGRAGDGNDSWKVDPRFNNAGNNTGNNNINKRPALNTSDYNTASQYSIARSSRHSSFAEVHHIMSDDPDAVIIDSDSFSRLSYEQKENINNAITLTLPSITDGAPLDFKDRHALDHLRPRDFTNDYGLMFDNDIKDLSMRLMLKSSTVKQVGAAINTNRLLRNGHLKQLCDAFMDNKSAVTVDAGHQGKYSAPISQEYLANWFRENHIVGYKAKVSSATLNWQTVDNYLLFDLEKVNTDKELERKAKERNRRFGKIAVTASRNKLKNEQGSLVEYLSDNPYIKPEEILQLAKLTPGYKEIFESDAGNWEKYTLEEHTETVLRLFDKNYADALPASVLPTMRLALLVHDIGKPEAVKKHNKSNQEKYNVAFAEHFLRQNNVDEPTIELITTMVGKGMEWTRRWMLKREQGTGQQFYAFCQETMKRYLGTEQVDPKTVIGFRNMLEVLQTCDSAAYTTMAVTRTNGAIYYRNHPSFNDSFESFQGLTGQRARIK